MKLITCITAIMVFAGGQTSFHDGSDFQLIRESRGIRLYTRDLRLPDGELTRELKGEYTVKSSCEHMLQLIENPSYSRQWLSGINRIYTISQPNKNCWYSYLEYQLPWPFSNQDCILAYYLTSHSNGYTIDFVSLPDYVAEKEGVERITHLKGRWTIVKQGNGCKVSYTAYTADKAKYPRWIADPVVQQNLINSLYTMKDMAEKW